VINLYGEGQGEVDSTIRYRCLFQAVRAEFMAILTQPDGPPCRNPSCYVGLREATQAASTSRPGARRRAAEDEQAVNEASCAAHIEELLRKV
jgi:hypothetical protein